MLKAIYDWDQQLLWIYDQWLGESVFREMLESLSDIWLWSPIFVFLLARLYFKYEKTWAVPVFFGVSSLLLAQQVSFFISLFVQRHPPALLTDLLKSESLTVYIEATNYSFPDPAIASFTGLLVFVRLTSDIGQKWEGLIWGFLILLMGLGRMAAGDSFPLDLLGGALCGFLTGVMIARLAGGIEKMRLERMAS